ncbi:hypothetical protein MMC14_006990 [Varicellaria rhodocarpa]|nr:hypothetical protein [Varicellaria rhodocarpa]
MFSLAPLVSFLFAAFVAAQGPTTNFSSTDLTSVIGETDQTTRNSWCTSEKTTCGVLCNGANTPTGNTCDSTALSANCTCSANNSSPALQYYQGTLLSFICNKAQGDCNATNAGNLAGQQQCTVKYVCGNLNASQAAAAAVSTSSSSSVAATSTQATATSATGSGTSATASAKSFAIKVGQDYGAGIFAAGIMAAFGVML